MAQKAKDWPRAHQYGEVKRIHLPKHTIVVRGIWKARGDLYHVRLMRGKVQTDDPDRNVVWRGDYKVGDYRWPGEAITDGVRDAKKAAKRKK